MITVRFDFRLRVKVRVRITIRVRVSIRTRVGVCVSFRKALRMKTGLWIGLGQSLLDSGLERMLLDSWLGQNSFNQD